MSTDGTPDNVLFEWYGRYIGDPEAETDVYLGFALFFGGISLGAVGIGIFLLSALASGPNSTAFGLRQVAVVASAGGLPILLLGIVVLLPGDERMTYAAVGGLVVCLAAIALFVAVYPMHWNVDRTPDYSAQGVGIYAVGLVAVVGSTAAALVGHQVERAAPAGTREAAGGGDGDATEAETVSDEQVRRDIDDAMADANISWGGVTRSEGKRLELNTETVDDIDRTSLENAEATTVRSSGRNVDDALSNLRKLQGREEKTDTSTGVDDQTSALTELRKQQEAEELATDDETLLDRAKGLFSR
ncbi:MAG: permease [Haloplanus sp.]